VLRNAQQHLDSPSTQPTHSSNCYCCADSDFDLWVKLINYSLDIHGSVTYRDLLSLSREKEKREKEKEGEKREREKES
jgi:hypothetical protein